MIFVTVGTDMPFDRLMKGVDRWAKDRDFTDVFAQIGKGGWKPQHIESTEFLAPPEFKRRFAEASVIVAHAGMGTILSALHAGKPILVMPRRASLGEQRNEHQLATAKRMGALGNVAVAKDEEELVGRLDDLPALMARSRIGPFAGAGLTDRLRQFILERS